MRAFLFGVLLLVACGPSAPARPSQTAGEAAQMAVVQKPMAVAMVTEPDVLEPSMNSGTGNRDFDALTNAFLSYLTPDQQPMPYLAQELPSLEKGTWKILPNGQMETTYTLKKNATWHDGKPLTAQDFLFAHRVRTDPDVPVHVTEAERRISAARAIDDHTLFLTWKEPFVWAGMLHSEHFAPLPRHLLEDVYSTDKERFIQGPHWRSEFVGAGPYMVESWEPGAQMVLRAHPGFVFGKAPVDQITIKFIGDGNTIVANLLAGAVDVAFHSSIAYAQAQALEEAGWNGTVEYWRGNPRFIEFQMRDWGNQQKAVLDLRVRRALLHGIDRQSMIDALYGGRLRAHHVWLDPADPAFPAVDRAVTKYDFDVARAESLLREAGWAKGGDGTARNSQGEPISVPMLNHPSDLDMAEGAIVVNYWKAIGVPSEITRLTPAQMRDGELRSKFPAVAYNRRGLGYDDLVFTTANHATPENRWSGQNRNGYSNPVVDEYLQRALSTVDVREREPLFVEAFKAWTADAVVTPTHLQPRVVAYPAGLRGVKETWVGESGLIWNSWEWHWTQ